jgi:tetratricopeptide (TPR) repeat protein
MKTIRQRLLVARMVQDGYRRLLKFLCPDMNEICTDFSQNKVLQLVSIFEGIYNLTIEAWVNCDSEEEENIWFEKKLTPWDKEELFLAIVPSRRETSYAEVARLLTRRFSELSESAPLDDFIAFDEQSAPLFIERKLQWLKNDIEEQLRIGEIVHQLRTASPWRTLQQENSYWVVSQVAPDNTLSIKARDMAIQRMRELAATPSQTIGAILVELNNLLNCNTKERPKDAEMRVGLLIDEAQASSGYQSWCAVILQYKAKHFLAQNDFDSAKKCFSAALDACSEYNYGELRGEIARDTFATHVANRQFIPNNHEKYYRNMLAYNIIEGNAGKVPNLEDVALLVADYFWTDLYRPYPKYEKKAI